MDQGKFSIISIYKAAWNMGQEHLSKIFIALLILILLPSTLTLHLKWLSEICFSDELQKVTFSKSWILCRWTGIISALLLTSLLNLGFTKLLLNLYQNKLTPQFIIFQQYRSIPRELLILLQCFLIIFFSSIGILIIPIIISSTFFEKSITSYILATTLLSTCAYFAVRLSFVNFILMDQDIDAVGCIRESFRITKGRFFHTAIFCLASWIIDGLGYLLFQIEISQPLLKLSLASVSFCLILVTIPLTWLAWAAAYIKLKELSVDQV